MSLEVKENKMSKGRRSYYDYDSQSNKSTDVTDEVKEYEQVTEDTFKPYENLWPITGNDDHKKEVVVSCNNLLNVRTSPELGSFDNVKCRVANGTHLEFADEIGDWYKVKLSDNSFGYILKEFAIMV